MPMWDDVCDFHEKFNIPQMEVPGFLEPELMQYRINFLMEEVAEFKEAYEQEDLTQAFDALIDIVYVALGTAHMMRFPWDEGWEHVQNANMRKRRAKDASESKRQIAVDIIKPKGWVSPTDMLLMEIIRVRHEALMRRFDCEEEEEEKDAV
jgi:predicted HAD superfamily Cof-like phosphohydrolase